MSVFVLDRKGKPLMPCSEKRARLLLERRRARVHRVVPFTIRLVDRLQSDCELQPIRIKIDPGSKTSGLAVVREKEKDSSRHETVIALLEIEHRGRRISEALTARRSMRRRRRGKLRYRQPRFLNRTKPAGWLAPSLRHRVDTVMAWVQRIDRLAPVSALSSELVRFDTHALRNPEITGVEYQQGTLHGYEVREYLLEKWNRTCAYCGNSNIPLEIDHIKPKSEGGSDSVSNLTLACRACNQKKGASSIEKFLAKKPEHLARILAQARRPLKDAAAVNATRWALANQLKRTGYPVELSSGGRTKYNRNLMLIPKTHALDAACVGLVSVLDNWRMPTLRVKCTGRGSYQRTRLDRFGFPRGFLIRHKAVHGFQTGDLVHAVVVKGKHRGEYIGRTAIRERGSFVVQTATGKIDGVSHKNCRLLQRADGYQYLFSKNTIGDSAFPPA